MFKQMMLILGVLGLLASIVLTKGQAAVTAVNNNSMSYLDNGHIRLGADLSIGGAVTYLSKSGQTDNLINSFDWGRQVQLSFYSGPVPFRPTGATLAKEWEALGWNPIQAGDHYKHGSKVIAHHNDGNVLRIKCVPMIWPLDNVPAECTFETEYRLVGNTVEVDCRLNNARADANQYAGRDQELPAVYTCGKWYKLVSYLGDKPFTGAPLTTLVDYNDGKGWPWLSFFGTEHWAALVNRHDQGLGVFEAEAFRFSGGFAGASKGSGGPKDNQTGYMSPIIGEILDHNIVYTYRYVLIVGTLSEIRQYACAQNRQKGLPAWRFETNRQHWIYENTTDAGWPIKGELCINLGKADAAMVSPLTFWRAEVATKLRVEAAFETSAKELQIVVEPFTEQERRGWPCWGEGATKPDKPHISPVKLPIVGDGKLRTYEADLSSSSGYRGSMIRLKLILPSGPGVARVRLIALIGKQVTPDK
ncbi:MAG: hypothetical protein Q7T18_05590 [Sedimentisphaerales bacterium]|nr:hypothetical protein [Sedimentisphaerales bacterium]